ncbi:MAG: deoxyguanosinetriphosphate triphosphohydrolase [Fimbriimonadaceae bacterium]
MPDSIRRMLEDREYEILSPYAAKARDSQGREQIIEEDPVRTCFQRDRDRILHSKVFRRLKHKTQVFIDPAGDHFRTRLTHSLEVAQVSRTISRALRLNEDLTEAIALAHDVGHPPFGHAGEFALDEAIKELKQEFPDLPDGFRHDEQSLRVLTVLTDLNLTWEVRQGVGGHSKGVKDLSDADGARVTTLEAAVVRISDRLAYLHHDLDDALRSGMIDSVPEKFERLGRKKGERLGTMVLDVIQNSLNQDAVKMSPDMQATLNDLKDWLFEHVYWRYPREDPDSLKAKAVVKELLKHYVRGGEMPSGFSGSQGAIDYVAGMTDRFAIETFRKLRLPEGFLQRVAEIR